MNSAKSDFLYLLRVGIVFLATTIFTGIVFSVVLCEVNLHQNIIEGGLVEKTQAAVLLAAGLAYLVQAPHRKTLTNALVLVGLCIFTMFVRECDGYFDHLTGDHAFWSYIVAAIFAAMVAYATWSRRTLLPQIVSFVRSGQFLMLAIGFIFAVVIAQLIGYKEIWNTIFDHPDSGSHEAILARSVKNTVEESFELGSYLIILASSFLPQCLRRKDD